MLDTWSLCKILGILYHHRLYCQADYRLPPVSHFIRERRLRFSGHVACVDPKHDHHRVIGASLRPPSHWRRHVDTLVPAGPGRLILVYSQSTSGSTQLGESPVTARSGDVSSTRQHSIMGHAATEDKKNFGLMSIGTECVLLCTKREFISYHIKQAIHSINKLN